LRVGEADGEYLGMETVTVGAAELWTDTTGAGDTPVVLCHGGPGLSDNLLPVASMIDDLAVVHRYDQRASGRSTGDGPFSVARFVEDLEGLRRHWEHPGWIVGGHSWGGWLALMYALRHPGRVSAIVAIGTPPPPSDAWNEAYRRARDSRMTLEELAFFQDIRLRRRTGAPLSEDEDRRWAHLNWRTEFADVEAAPDFDREPLFSFPANHDVNRALGADMDAFAATHDLLAELGSMKSPAMFIHGDEDLRPAPTTVVEALPDARLVRIADAGHLPWLERPTEVARALRAFVSSRGLAP
jgi:proline iminopeptidase